MLSLISIIKAVRAELLIRIENTAFLYFNSWLHLLVGFTINEKT